jgi:hypothetical protein
MMMMMMMMIACSVSRVKQLTLQATKDDERKQKKAVGHLPFTVCQCHDDFLEKRTKYMISSLQK